MDPIRERAKRIEAIRVLRKNWRKHWFFNNHMGASHEFQLIDVLRDIRGLLLLIVVLLMIIEWKL